VMAVAAVCLAGVSEWVDGGAVLPTNVQSKHTMRRVRMAAAWSSRVGGRHRPRRIEQVDEIESNGGRVESPPCVATAARTRMRHSRGAAIRPGAPPGVFAQACRRSSGAKQKRIAALRCPSPSASFLSHAAAMAMQCAHLSPRSPASLQPRTRARMGRVAVVSAAAGGSSRGGKRESRSAEGKKKREQKASQTDQLHAEVASLRFD